MRLFAALLLALSSTIAHAAAVWDVNLHALYSSDTFSMVGEFTTAGTDFDNGQLITSFSGTVDGVAADLTTSGNFTFDQLFYGPSDRPGYAITDSFDDGGLLVLAGDRFVNVFGGATFPIVDIAVGDTLVSDFFVDGSITFDRFTSTVPEPSKGLLLLLGFCATLAARRTR